MADVLRALRLRKDPLDVSVEVTRASRTYQNQDSGLPRLSSATTTASSVGAADSAGDPGPGWVPESRRSGSPSGCCR